MLAFTPTVSSALRWFRWTYTLTVIPMVGGRFARTSWPREGGAGQQDAWLTAALDVLCETHNELLREASARQRDAEPKTRDRSKKKR